MLKSAVFSGDSGWWCGEGESWGLIVREDFENNDLRIKEIKLYYKTVAQHTGI